MKYGKILLAGPLALGLAIAVGIAAPAVADDKKMEETQAAPKQDWRAKLGGAYVPSDDSEQQADKADDKNMEKIEPAAGPAMEKKDEMKK